MFSNINDFSDFKTICLTKNIEYHTYTINTEKTLTIVLKGLIRLLELRICNNLKSQVCVKYVGQHDTRSYKKIPEAPPTCANCKGAHPANYSKCPILLAFSAKKIASNVLTQYTQ
ncbi:unnamed protein product [Heterotrigona itama]|uniref:Pre-C2HC domain-containing protein n=1 Tax=Heterotrigona itama TaxID=395501 RepID=A0A6V7HJE0_9HYME|nr:unnamed protein product [Heterotrigona itama]